MWSTGLYLLKWCLLQLTEGQCFKFAGVSRLSTCPNCSQTFRNLESIFSAVCIGFESKSHPEVFWAVWWFLFFEWFLLCKNIYYQNSWSPYGCCLQVSIELHRLTARRYYFTSSFYAFLSHLVFNGSQDYILFIKVIFLTHDYRNPLCCSLIQNQIL